MSNPTTLCIDYKDFFTEGSPRIDSIQYPGGRLFDIQKNPQNEKDEMVLAALSHMNNTDSIFDAANSKIKNQWKHLSQKNNFHYSNLQSHLVTHRTKSENILFVIGNPFHVLRYTHLRSGERYHLQKNLTKIMSEGFHVTGIGYKEQYHSDIYDNDVHGMKWLAAMRAELHMKKDIHKVLKNIQQQNLSLRIFSDDPLPLCVAVAKKIGMHCSHETCVIGEDIQSMSDKEMISILPHTTLFAELTELDKIRLTRLLESTGEIVTHSYGEYTR